MKKYLYLFVAALAALTLASCQEKEKPDDGKKDPAPAPTADFTYTVNELSVTFTNKSTNATSYKWDFGDGETITQESPVHTYSAAGEYTVTLTAANADGAISKKSATISLAGKAKAYFTATPRTDRAGKFGLTVDFDATASENASSIVWDFGDGESASEFKVSHTYADYGTYKVKATVTGPGGDSNAYESSVEVIAYNELLKGGEFEEDDAQFWTYWSTEVFPEGNYETPTPGLLSWVPTFGYTADGPKNGNGGCLHISSENQVHDQANNWKIWQAIEVEEGDRLEISAQMKWGEGTNDCGLLWFGIAYSEDEIGTDGTSVVEMFNYWDPDWGAMRANSVPPIDSGFEADANYIADNEARGLGYSNAGEPVAVHWAQKTGTVYFYIDYRSVWGTCFGPGVDLFFDSISVKVTYEE